MFQRRELLIREHTEVINALHGHPADSRQVVLQVVANAARLISVVEDPDTGLPGKAITTLKVLVAALTHLEEELGKLNDEVARCAKENAVAGRLITLLGIGPLIATASAVLAPPPVTFRSLRDLAA